MGYQKQCQRPGVTKINFHSCHSTTEHPATETCPTNWRKAWDAYWKSCIFPPCYHGVTVRRKTARVAICGLGQCLVVAISEMSWGWRRGINTDSQWTKRMRSTVYVSNCPIYEIYASPCEHPCPFMRLTRQLDHSQGSLALASTSARGVIFFQESSLCSTTLQLGRGRRR